MYDLKCNTCGAILGTTSVENDAGHVCGACYDAQAPARARQAALAALEQLDRSMPRSVEDLLTASPALLAAMPDGAKAVYAERLAARMQLTGS